MKVVVYLISNSNKTCIVSMNTSYESIAFRRVDAKETIPHLISHLKEFPADAEAWVTLAAGRYEEGEIEKARKTLEKAFQLQPDLPNAWLEKGRWLFREGSLKEAHAAMNQALALRPQNDTILTFRGMVRRRMGKTEDAKEDFVKAIAINPSQEDALWQLRMFQEQKEAYEDGSWVTIASHFDSDWLFMIKTMLLEHQIPTRISQQDTEFNLDASTDHNRKLQVRLEESENAIWLVYDWARDYHYRYQSDVGEEDSTEKIKVDTMKKTGNLILIILVPLIIGIMAWLLTK